MMRIFYAAGSAAPEARRTIAAKNSRRRCHHPLKRAIGGLALPSGCLGFPNVAKRPVAGQLKCLPCRRVKSNFLPLATWLFYITIDKASSLA